MKDVNPRMCLFLKTIINKLDHQRLHKDDDNY